MEFKPKIFCKRKQSNVSVHGLIESRKKRLLETFSELTLNDEIHKLEGYKDANISCSSFYEKDPHTTIIENIEDFTNNEEEKVESSVSLIQGVDEKISNIPHYVLQSKQPVTDLILYKSPKCIVYEFYKKEASKCKERKDMPENVSTYLENVIDKEDVSMNIDI
ncbi:hypothetical protein PORY_000131 [Pneumocystis oryctolagi]|uniref:Uncharacterized protein n=1 Tax=Pneumocystis oryctolagi TaxID=42067 RepID=A0ACB7CGG5_9ASCO|nr:hypothetical protein PORY_000131 [Pneumocystis oryctolagi]